MTFFIVAWEKRRSTRTTMVLSCLSLTTTPCSVRSGISNPLLLLRFRLGGGFCLGLRGGLRFGGLGLLFGRLRFRSGGGFHFRLRHAGALLRGDGFHARDVAADDAYARSILELTGGALEAQVEL